MKKKLGDLVYKDSNIQTLLDVIEKIDTKTRDEVLRAISQRLTKAGKEKAISNIKKIIESSDPEIKKWLAKAIPESYVDGLAFSDYEFSGIRLNSKTVDEIIKSTYSKVDNIELANKLKNIDTTNIYSWGDLYKKIGRSIDYNKEVMGSVREDLLSNWKTYNTGPVVMKKEVDSQFEKYKLNFTADDIKVASDLSIHADTVNALLSDAYLDFANGMNGLIKGANHQINEAIKRQIRGKILAKEISGQDITKVARDVKKLVGNQGFSVLVDRGGHNWTLKRYSEMLVRTHVIKASNEALINRAGQFGVDIVQISTHQGACQICIPYEGKIYSLSGNSNKYSKIPINLPIHPNCRHVLLMRPDL